MKSKDQILLEQAYQSIYLQEHLLLIEEGKITDFLKRLGKGATNTFLKAKNALTTNPSLMKKFTIASSILLALAAGNTAQAATYGADAVNDLIQQLTSASTDGSLDTAELQKIMSGWEASHQDITSTIPNADAVGDQMVQQSEDSVRSIKKVFSGMKGDVSDIDSLAQGIGNLQGADDIKQVVNKYDVEVRNLNNPSSLQQVANDIASEAKYRKFSVEQVKQILSSIDQKNLSPKLNLQKLISLIKF
jgi:hypothetical protein